MTSTTSFQPGRTQHGFGWYVRVALWIVAGILYWGRYLQVLHMLWVGVEWFYYSSELGRSAPGWGLYQLFLFGVLVWSHVWFLNCRPTEFMKRRR